MVMATLGLFLLPCKFSFSLSKCIFLLIFCFLAGAQNFLVQMYLQMAQPWVVCGVWVDSAQPGTKLQSLIILGWRAYVRFQYQTSRYQHCCAQALPSVALFERFWGWILSFVTVGWDREYPQQPSFSLWMWRLAQRNTNSAVQVQDLCSNTEKCNGFLID